MANTLLPQTSFAPLRIPSLWDEDLDLLPATSQGNISVSEDDKHVFIEAAVPGINPEDIDVTYDKGMLWINGETIRKEEDKKKYYRQAANSFSYRITVPGELDENTEPEARCENGIVTVTFTKTTKSQPRKIRIKGSDSAKKIFSKKAD